MTEPTDEQKRTKSIKMGKALLKPVDEPEHYGLFRQLFVDGWDEDHGNMVRIAPDDPVGPLAVFRVARNGETVHMKTFHPELKTPLDLTCVWDGDTGTYLRGEPR